MFAVKVYPIETSQRIIYCLIIVYFDINIKHLQSERMQLKNATEGNQKQRFVMLDTQYFW